MFLINVLHIFEKNILNNEILSFTFYIQVQDIFDAMTEEMAKEVIRKRSLPLEEFEALKDEVREVFR